MHPLFVILDAAVNKEAMLPALITRNLTQIFHPDSVADSLYLLRSGRVKIVAGGPRRQIILRMLAGPDVFGDEGFCAGEARGVYAYSMGTITLVRVPRELVLAALCSTREGPLILGDFLDGRRRDLRRRIEVLTECEAYRRVVSTLIELAHSTGEQIEGGTRVAVNQTEIASMAGMARETASTSLKTLEREGLILNARNRVVIRSLPGLSRLLTLAAAASRGA